MNNKDAKTQRLGMPGRGRTLFLCFFVVQNLFVLFSLLLCGFVAAAGPVLETNPTNVAKMLAAGDTWVLPQPKAVATHGGVL